MKTDKGRIERLINYVQGIRENKNGRELYELYREDIGTVTPQEVFEIFYSMLQEGTDTAEILVFLDKIINVFYKSLKGYPWQKPEENSFLGVMLKENKALLERLETIKVIIGITDLHERKKALLPKIAELCEIDRHYLKKENIFFPYLERKMEKFNGLSIMWALHDEARKRLAEVCRCLEAESCGEDELNVGLGSLFFALYGLAQKEELILFPAADEVIGEKEWAEMQEQSFEYGFSFIDEPAKKGAGAATGSTAEVPGGCFLRTDTGVLELEQVLMIFNTLPLDLTFVDEDNKVRFFTKPKDRIFPRSSAVIGRNVENCHPPESVHVVNEIIESFRSGSQDNAAFWINLKGRKILIQYFALRDNEGRYKGVLEASQDITELSKLEGERRLLHWGK